MPVLPSGQMVQLDENCCPWNSWVETRTSGRWKISREVSVHSWQVGRVAKLLLSKLPLSCQLTKSHTQQLTPNLPSFTFNLWTREQADDLRWARQKCKVNLPMESESVHLGADSCLPSDTWRWFEIQSIGCICAAYSVSQLRFNWSCVVCWGVHTWTANRELGIVNRFWLSHTHTLLRVSVTMFSLCCYFFYSRSSLLSPPSLLLCWCSWDASQWLYSLDQ